jgi:hypothetical protein
MSSANDEILTRTDNVATLPFWLQGQLALSMSFQNVDGKVIVRGRNPQAASGNDASVFEAELRTEQKDAFIAAVRENRQAQPIGAQASNANEATASTVIIIGPGGGDGSGPKMQYELELTLASNR